MTRTFKKLDHDRVRTLLGHLGTLREARRILKEEYPLFVACILDEVRRKLKTQPALRRWKFFLDDAQHPEWLSLAPSNWRVLKKHGTVDDCLDYLQIEIGFYDAKDPTDSSEDGPWVALDEPEGWRLKPQFRKRLVEALPPTLKSWKRQKHMDYSPIWMPVDYEGFTADGEFDDTAFTRKMVSTVLTLADIKPKIDYILRTM